MCQSSRRYRQDKTNHDKMNFNCVSLICKSEICIRFLFEFVFQVFLVVCLVAGAYAREYPAGLFPALCPDYPNCDNALLARYFPDGQPKPEYLLAAPVAPVPTVRTE